MTLTASIASLLGEETVLVRIVGAVLIIITGFVIGHLLGSLFRRLLRELRVDAGVRRMTSQAFSLERNLSVLLSLAIYAATILLALAYLRLTRVVLLAFLAIVGLLILISLFLSLKDLLPNAWGGTLLAYKHAFRKNDRLRIRGVDGVVTHRGLFTTTVADGHDRIIIPNRLFLRESYSVTKGRSKKKR
jgi:small-conductance mechanosensitive channel